VLDGNDEGMLGADGALVQSQVHLLTNTGHQVNIHLQKSGKKGVGNKAVRWVPCVEPGTTSQGGKQGGKRGGKTGDRERETYEKRREERGA
jgi:hypothetical protein